MPQEATAILKVHVALFVRDVARSAEFYRKVFGAAPSKVRPGYAKFDLANPPLNFTLNETGGPVRGGLSHLGFQVASTEQVIALRDRWRAAGLETRDEMHTECCYALQDKAWVRDPDGNEWEVFVVLGDSSSGERSALPAKQNACCEPACCAGAER